MATRSFNGVTLALLEGDIVSVRVDAIVNAANSGLLGGGGVDGAIHRAGGPAIMAECRKIGGCQSGRAVATTAGNLPATYVFHAVGPVYGYDAAAEDLLASAYQSCLDLAEQYKLESIAFPALSTGAYRFPLDLAARIALRTIIEYIRRPTTLRQVILVLYGARAYQVFARTLEEIA